MPKGHTTSVTHSTMTLLSVSQTTVDGVQGKCVGPYELLETLGSGNFGKVKRGRHIYTGVHYAIKVVEKTMLTEDMSGTMDIRREMSILRALEHRNIIQLHEVMESSKRVYLVMDLATRGDFYSLLVRKGRLSEGEARKYFQQLVDAVRYCHTRGIFHRDLKPENLLLDSKSDLQVTDFGFGAMLDRAGEVLRTSCGSPHYCAPEVWSGNGEGYDGAKADAFSMGVILYTFVVGGQPFNHGDEGGVLRKVAECRPVYPRFLSKAVVEVLKGLLVREPERRWNLGRVWEHRWVRGGCVVERRFVLVGVGGSGGGCVSASREEKKREMHLAMTHISEPLLIL